MFVRILAAAIAGSIIFFCMGFVIYGLLLDSLMKGYMVQYPGLMKDPPAMVVLFLWNFVMALFFTLVFDKWAGIRSFAGGLVGGAFMMFFIELATDLSYMAFMNLMNSFVAVVIDVAGATVLGAVAGGVIGAVLGLMNKEPAAA